MRPSVADGKRKIVAHPLVHADEQAVVNGIPTGLCFEEDAIVRVAEAGDSVDVGYACNHHRCREIHVGSTGAVGGVGNSTRLKVEVHILATRLPLRVVELHRAGRVRLIHVVKAAQVDSAQVDSCDAQQRILEGLEFQRGAGLNTVRVLAILIEPDDGRGLQEATTRQSSSRAIPGNDPDRAEPGRYSVRIICLSRGTKRAASKQRSKRGICDEWGAGKTKKASFRIQTVFKWAPRIGGQAAARWRLTHEQGCGDNSVQQSRTPSKY